MSINSLSFLLFFIITLGAYYYPHINSKQQNIVLLIASLLFYGYTSYTMLLLLLISIYIFWVLGKFIAKLNFIYSNILTGLGIILGCGLLLYFKYFNFFILSFSSLLNSLGLQTNWSTFKIIMPLGISFFTFRLISYIIDIKRKDILPCENFINFANYISFFPCILSGPIDRAIDFLPQLTKKREFNQSLIVEGCRQILWGIFKKMVIADSLATFLSLDVNHVTGSTLLFMAILYSVQIYTDFSGYSDMAIGVAKILGIKTTINFQYPYFSRSISEFWKRWHISLLSWLRYYLYFPLGGSYCSKLKTIRNTLIIFLVSGLWHGANWTFLIWGLFHAILFLPIIIRSKKRIKPSCNYNFIDSLKMLGVFILVTIGWIIFQSENLSEVQTYITKICSVEVFYRPSGLALAYTPMFFAAIMFIIEWFKKEDEFPLQKLYMKKSLRWTIYILLILVIVFYQGKPTDFIYFKF